MVLDSQVQEAEALNKMLMSDINIKEGQLHKYTSKIKEQNIAEDKERKIQKQAEELETLRNQLQELQNHEKALRTKNKQLKDEKDQKDSEILNMKSELEQVKHNLVDYDNMKKQTKYQTKKIQELEGAVKKVKEYSENVLDKWLSIPLTEFETFLFIFCFSKNFL